VRILEGLPPLNNKGAADNILSAFALLLAIIWKGNCFVNQKIPKQKFFYFRPRTEKKRAAMKQFGGLAYHIMDTMTKASRWVAPFNF